MLFPKEALNTGSQIRVLLSQECSAAMVNFVHRQWIVDYGGTDKHVCCCCCIQYPSGVG